MTEADNNKDAGKSRNRSGRRSAARLVAIQALYQIEITGIPADQVIADFIAGKRPVPDGDDAFLSELPEPDPALFGAIVRGVVEDRSRLDEMIDGALSKDWSVNRLEILVRLIMEAGIFEITSLDNIPPKVSINEYINVSHAFFDGMQPGLVNGVLDAIAKAYGESKSSSGLDQ